MNIAMIGHKRIPGREGGVEVVVEELAVRMAAIGHTVTAYNRHGKNHAKQKEFNKVTIKNAPTINHKKLDAIVYSFLASVHACFCKYDVIHYHAIGPSSMLIIPHLFGKKTVVTVHGLNYKTPKWKGFGAKYLMFSEKIVAKYADEIIVLSEEQKKYFKEKYNRDTYFIPNGVTIRDIKNASMIKDNWNLEKDSYFLFLSRLVPGKGLEYIIEAFKKVETDKKLVISGEGVFVDDYLDTIHSMCDGDNRILFTGYVEGQLLDELYSNAYAFVFPSEAEGMPMCLLEALSYNCRCIVSDIPENIEVLKQYGYSFESKNSEDLKNKIELLLKEQKEFLDSREYIKTNYNWDNVVESTLEVYRRLV